jgi:hypothetical protein
VKSGAIVEIDPKNSFWATARQWVTPFSLLLSYCFARGVAREKVNQ